MLGNQAISSLSAASRFERRQGYLGSWKEIAVYLDRDVRTVQRWEKREGLPVRRHRHQHGSSVHAFQQEIDRWQKGRAIIQFSADDQNDQHSSTPGRRVTRIKRNAEAAPLELSLQSAKAVILVEAVINGLPAMLLLDPGVSDALTVASTNNAHFGLNSDTDAEAKRKVDFRSYRLAVA